MCAFRLSPCTYAHTSPTSWSRSAFTAAQTAANRGVIKPQAEIALPNLELKGIPGTVQIELSLETLKNGQIWPAGGQFREFSGRELNFYPAGQLQSILNIDAKISKRS